MELIIGVNSYMTIEQADNLVHMMYKSNSDEVKYWDALSDHDKAVDIINNTELFENNTFCWHGRKADVHQNMMWPRVLCDGSVIDFPLIMMKGIIANIMFNAEKQWNESAKLMDDGVKDYKIKDASVSFFENSSNNKYNSLSNSDISKRVFITYFSEYSACINL